jgi:predicted ATPase
MIGREADLAHLQQAFQGSFLENKGLQVITVSGDAGIGKSRLLYEFNTWAEVQPLNWWVFKGRASLAAQHTPYALLRDIFLFRFEIQDSDSLAIAHEKIEQGFREFLPEDPDALEKAHILGHLVGLDFSSSPHLRGLLDDPRQLRQQALYYLTQFFRAASDQLPSLLMLDDLHWADTGSLDALSYLFANLPLQTRLLTVAVTRPTLFEFYPTWGRSLAGFSRIELGPLDKADSRRLVEEILRKVPDLPDAIRELVVGGAEGNPFYLEEFVKMLIDEKVICPGDEAWRVESGRLASLNVPSTLTEIIHARLDGLSSEERIILQYASVYGRIFWDDALLAISADISRQSLSQTFKILLRKELIYERFPSAFAGTREFTFRQSLLQEVTYETLLKRQRAAYHLRAAHWLDQASGERRGEYLAQIAEHYERGGEHGHAAGVLALAAERALGLSALSEARSFFQQALNLLDQPDRPLQEVIQMELGLAEACLELGEYPQALRHAETASNMAADLQLDSLVAEALTLLGQISTNLGSHQDARSYLVGSLYLARKENTHSTLARALVALATVEWKLGDIDSALQNCEQGLQIAREIGDTTIELMALNRLGVIQGALGNPQLEASFYHQALDLALATGNRERAATAYNNLGALAGEQNEWDKAWEYYQRALQISSQTGAKQAESLHRINLGFAAIKLGKLTEARRFLRDGVAAGMRLGAMPITVFGITYFALLAFAEGQAERALELIGVARSCPAWDSENEREVNRFLAEWNLPAGQVERGLLRGQQMEVEVVLDELTRLEGTPAFGTS